MTSSVVFRWTRPSIPLMVVKQLTISCLVILPSRLSFLLERRSALLVVLEGGYIADHTQVPFLSGVKG